MANVEKRSTKPGRKRLLLTTITLISYLLGVPFWYKCTQIYRAPLPFEEIDAYANSVFLQLHCHLHVILASELDNSFTQLNLEAVRTSINQHMNSSLSGSLFDKESCQRGFDLLVTWDAPNTCTRAGKQQGIEPWPCGLGNPSSLKALHSLSDDAVDELLWDYSSRNSDGRPASYEGSYTIVVLQKEDVSKSYGTSDGGQTSKGNREEVYYPSDGDAQDGAAAYGSTVVGKYRHAWIAGRFDSLNVDAKLVSRISDIAVMFLRGSHIESAEDKDRSMPLSADGEAILSFSLLNAEPSDWIFDWDFEQLEELFLLPIVGALKCIARLKIESQVLYYTPKAVQSDWVPALDSYVITAKQLPFFVTANEWHLDSSSAATGCSKILHFPIYVPAANEWPLRFQLADGQLSSTNAFTSPGWGGVTIWNPVSSLPVPRVGKPPLVMLTTDDFRPLAGVFVTQLRTLFGLPPTPVKDNKTGVLCLPVSTTGFADWELDELLRRRATEDVAAAASTLTSLSRLVPKLPNMPIMDEIGDQVKSALAAATAAHDFAAQGNYSSTAEAACMARSLAEAGFFQPSIMSVLYNPTEHHLAIYTPFFVPVLLHVVLAMVIEISRYRREWREFKQKLQ